MASDDPAIRLFLNSGRFIFPETPIVFCGANDIEIPELQQHQNMTGVMEHIDIKTTLDLALRLQPNVQKVVVINDRTVSGQLVDKELRRVLPDYSPRLDITLYPDLPLPELAEKVSQLDHQTMVLLLLYLRDSHGTYYDPEIVAKALSQASPVPIYGVYDFYFNHGITGGVMTSGYSQGELAGDIGVSILQGKSPGDIKTIQARGNQVIFDFRAMRRFALPIEQLPREAVIENISYGNQKNVLMLHSYSANNSWTQSIAQGMMDQFAQTDIPTNLFTEFMDTKGYSDKLSLNSLREVLQRKYASMDLDLVLVSDDNAYNFVLRNREVLFGTTPIVFCGVNYLKRPQQAVTDNITGVMETYDVLSTIELGLVLFPDTTVFLSSMTIRIQEKPISRKLILSWLHYRTMSHLSTPGKYQCRSSSNRLLRLIQIPLSC